MASRKRHSGWYELHWQRPLEPETVGRLLRRLALEQKALARRALALAAAVGEVEALAKSGVEHRLACFDGEGLAHRLQPDRVYPAHLATP